MEKKIGDSKMREMEEDKRKAQDSVMMHEMF
jgi:hypothetical protein